MAALAGEKTTLELSSDGTAWTAFVQVINLNGPNRSVPEVPKTTIGAAFKAFRPSLIPDNGTIDLELLFDHTKATHTIFETLMTSPATRYFRIKMYEDDGTTLNVSYTFQGFPTSFNIAGHAEDTNITATATVRITTLITIA